MPNPKFIEPDAEQQELLNKVVKNLQPMRDISSLFHIRSIPQTLDEINAMSEKEKLTSAEIELRDWEM